MPDMQYVNSSNIDQVGYEEDQRELHVVFKSGSHYVYYDVPAETFQQLVDAPSLGSFLNRELKNVYQFSKQ